MILCVALNAALDVTYRVDRLSDGEAVRVASVSTRPGGKGLNVAHVLAELSEEVAITGFVGGCRGQRISSMLDGARVRNQLRQIARESRQTVVAIASDGSFAEYDEPGAEVSAEEWERFLGAWPSVLQGCSSVVLAGSLPPGVPPDAYARLIAEAQLQGRSVVLDTSGAALERGIAPGPDVVKLNRTELSAHAGVALGDDRAVIEATHALRDAGAGEVIVTLGPDGSIAVGDGWAYRVRQPARTGSPVGAGDAFTAGLLVDAGSPAERLAFAAALASSAVGLDGAGMVDVAAARTILESVEVVPL